LVRFAPTTSVINETPRFLGGLFLTITSVSSSHEQQKMKVRRLAVVNPVDPVSAMPESGTAAFAPLFERLRQLGFVDGHSGEECSERFDEIAAQSSEEI